MKYKKILQQAVDLHVHIGPEIIPRKFDLPELLDLEKGKLKGVGVKNHFITTTSMTRPAKDKDTPFVIDSLVLNNYLGGFNPSIIFAAAKLSPRPIIVWFPTLNSKRFLEDEEFEVPYEWVKGAKTFVNRKANQIRKLTVLDANSNISNEVKEVLLAIKKTGAILATGHISWQESQKLVKCAVDVFKIKKIIITHPIYQRINMPIKVQREIARMGGFIEQCYSMYSIDKISIDKISSQIMQVGTGNCILTSDVGQIFSKNPSDSLADFMYLLEKEGFSEKEMKTMLVENPNYLIK